MQPESYYKKLSKHLKKLLAIPSVSPHDLGCQEYISTVLQKIGFTCQHFPKNNTNNLYAEIGNSGPLLLYAGHTDVVEPGPISSWHSPPFTLTEHNDAWFGRGIADMKGSIAAMLVALEMTPNFPARIGLLLTSAEEGNEYLDGTPYVMAKLHEQGKRFNYCIIGEPSAECTTGDSMRIGRRGSLNARLLVHGMQGHVAYPDLAINAAHTALPFLQALVNFPLDNGDDFFPPSSLQITNVATMTSASNIIPGVLEINFNIRFNPQQTSSSLKLAIENLAEQFALKTEWRWELSGEPFHTTADFLINLCQNSIKKHTKNTAKLSTGGGTSDGRFIAPYGIPVVELGLPNSSIHKINEHVLIKDVVLLSAIYQDILANFFQIDHANHATV